MGDCFLRKAAAGHKVQRDAAFAALSQATLLSYRNELLSLKLQCFPRIERDALEIGMNVIIMRDGSGAALVMSSKGAVVGVARQADSESAAQLLDDLGGMLVGVIDGHSQVGEYFTVKCVEGGTNVEADAGQATRSEDTDADATRTQESDRETAKENE